MLSITVSILLLLAASFCHCLFVKTYVFHRRITTFTNCLFTHLFIAVHYFYLSFFWGGGGGGFHFQTIFTHSLSNEVCTLSSFLLLFFLLFAFYVVCKYQMTKVSSINVQCGHFKIWSFKDFFKCSCEQIWLERVFCLLHFLVLEFCCWSSVSIWDVPQLGLTRAYWLEWWNFLLPKFTENCFMINGFKGLVVSKRHV